MKSLSLVLTTVLVFNPLLQAEVKPASITAVARGQIGKTVGYDPA